MKSVHELSTNELEELRTRWYMQHEDDGSLEEVMGLEEGEEITEDEIPMEVVVSYYEGTYFVDEDFFCNVMSVLD
jgi:hypothetical protein